MSDKLNIPDELAEQLARLAAQAGARPEEIEDEIRKRRAAQTGFALGASVLIQREEDEIDTLDHERGQYDQIQARARRLLNPSSDTGNGSDRSSDGEQGNPPAPPADQPPIHAEFSVEYVGLENGKYKFGLDASASTGSGNLTYRWDAGDGRPTCNANSHPAVSYSNEGEYEIILMVTDSQGRSDFARQTVQAPPDTDDTRVMPRPPARTRGQHAWHSHWGTIIGTIVGVIVGTLLVAPLSDSWVPNDNHDVLEAFWYVAMALVLGGAGFMLGWYADHQGRGISDAGEE